MDPGAKFSRTAPNCLTKKMYGIADYLSLTCFSPVSELVNDQ